MRVAVYQLVTQEIDYIGDIELALLLADLGIEDYMQEHIAELLGNVLRVLLHYGIAEFIYLLYSLGTQRLGGLFPVPRTFHAQFVQDVQYPAESL